MSGGFAHIQRFLRDAAGIALDDDKRYFIEDRLQPVLRDAKLTGLDALAGALHGNTHSELAQTVIETLTINETSFFRDRALFTAFADRLLPQLIAARQDTRRLRIWCAGCSTGQEPYSVAMAIDEKTRQLTGWQVEILATDLSRPVLEHARSGSYSQFEVQRGLPVAMLLRHFSRRHERWQISDYLRAKLVFKVQNLTALPSDMGTFDAIFCRNVLFYFDARTKQRVLARLTDLLAEDGFLVLGGAERLGSLCPRLHASPDTPFVFVRNDKARRRRASSL